MLRAAFRTKPDSEFQQPTDFSGQVAWERFSDDLPPLGTEIFFDEISETTVRIGLVTSNTSSEWFQLEIQFESANHRSAIAATIHAVIAPAFAPGGIGVDWEDVKLLLQSGNVGQLIESPEEDGEETALPFGQQIMRDEISASLGVVSIRRGQSFRSKASMVSQFIRELDPNDLALRMIAAPFTEGPAAIYSLLFITRSRNP